jgi:hypothetical protein
MWQAGVNERGGLLGRAVELVLRDDGSSPERAAEHYAAMRASGISLFISPYSSEMTLAARDTLGAADIAMVAIASAPQIWETEESRIFGAYTPANHNMDPLLHMVAKRGLSRVALVYQDSEFPTAVAEGVRAKASELKLSIVFDQSYAEDTTNFTGIAQAIKKSQPEAIVVGSYLQKLRVSKPNCSHLAAVPHSENMETPLVGKSPRGLFQPCNGNAACACPALSTLGFATVINLASIPVMTQPEAMPRDRLWRRRCVWQNQTPQQR